MTPQNQRFQNRILEKKEIKDLWIGCLPGPCENHRTANGFWTAFGGSAARVGRPEFPLLLRAPGAVF